MSAGAGAGARGAGGAGRAAELCAPLLLCGLCCWPLDDRDKDADDASSAGCGSGKGMPPQEPAGARVPVPSASRRRRRSSEALAHTRSAHKAHKAVSSAASLSLHLPSTSGHSKQSLAAVAAHRSHEEIRSRRPSHSHLGPGGAGGGGDSGAGGAAAGGAAGRYHSAPSVIDEVLHRRDWERSSRELYIPLRPEADLSDAESAASSPPSARAEPLAEPRAAPRAEPESSSVECIMTYNDAKLPCKKHHTNIKSSRNRTTKERNQDDVKDKDATESESEHGSTSYIRVGDSGGTCGINKEHNYITDAAAKTKSVYKAKDAKQCFNESIRTKDRPHVPLSFDNPSLEGYHIRAMDIDLDYNVEELDRSGATHWEYPAYPATTPGSLTTVVSRADVFPPAPPSSVEAVGWEGGACYLREGAPPGPGAGAGSGSRARAGGRGRHASDGDILAPAAAQRPESGAFSESDLELELELAAERPPPYEDLQPPTATTCRKETAI